ncbi:MAG TPA: oligogalacturonate lyase family protein [Tepidisphaeraceae bacterium]|nr:oligogalacturonate lyase family protein [Tepidisphaeraceae bacterium]
MQNIFVRLGLIVASLCGVAVGQQTQPATGNDPSTGASFAVQSNGQPPPKEWIDKDTGHRVVRLSDEPGSTSLYFHQNAFSPDGKKLTFTSPTGIYQVDLGTRKIERILAGDTSQFTQGNTGARISMIVVGRKTGRIYFTKTVLRDSADPASAERSVWWIDPVTKRQREIGALPTGVNIGTVNCDETLLAGAITYLDGRGGATTKPVTAPRGQRINLYARWAQHLPMALVTMDAGTGEIKTFNPSNDWDNHFQFSPTDPSLLMFCHEGPWQNNDRVWTIHTDGTGLFNVHRRTMINEIWGHEFWAADGRTIWYQLYYPRGDGSTSWIAGYGLDTHRQTWYLRPPDTGSIHVNVSKDGSLFAGDGGNGSKWIFLFRPHLARNLAAGVYDSSHLIQPGHFDVERLVNMSKHNYHLEPNVNFTPDMKWIIFRSNMFGPSYAFAVEVAKAK